MQVISVDTLLVSLARYTSGVAGPRHTRHAASEEGEVEEGDDDKGVGEAERSGGGASIRATETIMTQRASTTATVIVQQQSVAQLVIRPLNAGSAALPVW